MYGLEGEVMAEAKYVAYYRVSTDRQGKSGLGLEAQRKAVIDHLNGNGTRVLAEYTEVESGKRTSRPELIKALAACKEHKATLVIAKLDRLARNVHFVSGLMESGVEFMAVDMPQANRLTVHILAAVAEHEREMISQRTKVALAAAKARGVKLGRAKENRAEARSFARSLKPVIKKLASEGITSVRKVSEALNERGIETPRGGRWHPTGVARLLARV